MRTLQARWTKEHGSFVLGRRGAGTADRARSSYSSEKAGENLWSLKLKDWRRFDLETACVGFVCGGGVILQTYARRAGSRKQVRECRSWRTVFFQAGEDMVRQMARRWHRELERSMIY